MNAYDVVRRPLITEKAVGLQTAHNQYAFAVDARATKYDVRLAIEKLFNVKVTNVTTMNVSGKYRRVGKYQGKMSNWKKAIVTLKTGQHIQLVEGT